MLNVGIAKADITPRAGIAMGGFGKRIQPSLGDLFPEIESGL